MGLLLAVAAAQASPLIESTAWVVWVDDSYWSSPRAGVIRDDPTLGWVVIDALSPLEALQTIGLAAVHSVPDTLLELATLTDDPLGGEQWALSTMEFQTAWGSDSVPLAVVDSGYATDHEDLGSVIRGWNTHGGNASVSDSCGHGTLVTGSLAATPDNARGIAGALRGTTTVYKAFERLPSGVCTGSWSSVASALRRAVDDGAQVVSLSAGSPGPSEVMDQAIEYALARHVVIVAAAGNGGCANCTLYPASDPRTIAVGCHDEALVACAFNSDGQYVWTFAPGVNITTTNQNGGYSRVSGTSIATPLAAAAVAYTRGANELLDHHAVRTLIRDTGSAVSANGSRASLDRLLANAPREVRVLSLVVTASEYEVRAQGVVESLSLKPEPNATVVWNLVSQDGRALDLVTSYPTTLFPGQRISVEQTWSVVPVGEYTVKLSSEPSDPTPTDNVLERSVAFSPDPLRGRLQRVI